MRVSVGVQKCFTTVFAGSLALGLMGAATQASAQQCALGDITAPQLVISSPDRSEALTQGDVADDIVYVVGQASDTQSTVASVTINGSEAILGQGGMFEPFSVEVTSRWGLNTIVAVATDECGNAQTIVQSYTRSGGYFPATTMPDSAAEAPNGFVTHLNESLLDDSHRSTLDDMASIIENAVPEVPPSLIPTTLLAASTPPCSSLFDNWVTGQNKVRVRKTAFSLSPIEIIGVQALSGELIVTGRIASSNLGIAARAYNCIAGNLLNVNRNGSIGANNIRFAMQVDLTVVNGNPVVSVSGFTMTNINLTASIGCVLQAICNAVINRAIPIVEVLLELGINTALEDVAVKQSLTSFLGGSVPTGGAIDLPAPLSPVAINLESPLSSIVVGTGDVLMVSSVQTYPASKGASIPLAAMGSIRRDGPITSFELTPELGNAIHDDMLNPLLWAIWYGGGLDIPDLTAEAAKAGVVLTQFSHQAGLPQVLMPGGSSGRVEVGKGDVLFTMEGDLADLAPPLSGPMVVSGYWSSLVGGTVIIDESGKRLSFATDASEASVEILTISPSYLKDTLVPILEARFAALDVLFVEQTFAQIKLPRIKASDVGGEPGVELAMANAGVERPEDNALRISGDLVASAICGDGVILSGETCDDANDFNGDGCSSSCQVEPGQYCIGAPSFCASSCGNLIIDITETCDDGGQLEGDGCSATCQIQDSVAFSGTATGGGEINLLVNGQLVVVATEAGDSAALVAQKLANAINWSIQSVVAGAAGGQLYATASFGSLTITDSGITSTMSSPSGDINSDGQVDIADLTLAIQIVLGLYDPTTEEQQRWDFAPLVNGEPSPNGINNIGDLLILQKMLLGMDN